jgi:FAD-dependent oxidoreductase domain-containing protein 1
MAAAYYDVVIIGGGIMGSASAHGLMKADPRLKVVVIERDPAYTRSSTSLSMSNARIQFSLKENVQISRYTFEVLKTFAEDMAVDDRKPNVGFRQEGNLFLVDEVGRESAHNAMRMQQELGCRVQWWTPEQITQHYPLYAAGAMAGGTFGPDDGHFDAYTALMGYKAKARAMGAVYLNDEATAINIDQKQVQGVTLKSGNSLKGGIVINCAGAWCAEIARTAGIELPVQPVKRQVFVLDTKVKPDGPLPLTVLPSGLYFRTETSGTILLGKSMPEDPVGYDFDWDDQRFMELLWPELAEAVPAFDTLKLVRGWAGLYAVNTLDGNAILGEWPECKGLLLANGFSGHGLQQGPAVGRYMAELVTGQTPALDLSIFSPQRILEGRPLSENGLV